MRICFIGDPRSVHTQRWVGWFARHHEVSLIATAPDAALGDVTVDTLPSSGPLRGLRLASSLRVVRRTVAQLRPDIVHGHFVNEAGWFAAASGRRPVIVTAWGSDLYRAPAESALARRLNPWATRSADRVTCDSHDQARLLRSWGVAPERIAVIGWGIDRTEFHPDVDGRPVRERLGIPARAPIVLSPRQWLHNSNIEAIIAAHALLGDDVHLILKRLPRFERADDVSTAVEQAIRDSPAGRRIHVVGEIPTDELPALYAAADAVVSLCLTDGTPVSLLEAMATGLPVVALRNPSVEEWISEPGGALVDYSSPQAVAAALDRLLLDADARSRAAAHNVAVVAARADRTSEMRRMEDIYAQAESTPHRFSRD